MSRARVINKLPQFVNVVEKNAARGMVQGLILGASEASVFTPIGDTSNLINSQYRSIEKVGTQIVGTVGYTAEYAEFVHDPDVKQQFRRATAKKEFLRLGFEAAEPNIRAVVIGSIKTP